MGTKYAETGEIISTYIVMYLYVSDTNVAKHKGFYSFETSLEYLPRVRHVPTLEP